MNNNENNLKQNKNFSSNESIQFNNNNFNNLKKTSKKYVLPIIVLAAISVIILFGINLILKSSSSNKNLIPYGETLNFQSNSDTNFDITVNSVNTSYKIENKLYGYDGEYVAVNVTVKNNSKEDLSLSNLNFLLNNSKDEKVGQLNFIYSYSLDGSISDTIKSNESTSGNLYFYGYKYLEDGSVDFEANPNPEVDTSDLNSMVISDFVNKYYLKLK